MGILGITSTINQVRPRLFQHLDFSPSLLLPPIYIIRNNSFFSSNIQDSWQFVHFSNPMFWFPNLKSLLQWLQQFSRLWGTHQGLPLHTDYDDIYLVLNVQILVLINGINYNTRSSDVCKKLKNPIKKRNLKLKFDAFFFCLRSSYALRYTSGALPSCKLDWYSKIISQIIPATNLCKEHIIVSFN